MYINKKVLLRERKRHTACHVVSTPSVVLTGYPPPADYPLPLLTWLGGCHGGGTLPRYPPGRVPPILTWPGGYPLAGYPSGRVPLPGRVPPCPDLAGGYPTWVPPGRVPPQQGTPRLDLAGYPPSQVSAPWHSRKCCKGIWVPSLWTDSVSKHYLPVVLRTRAVITCIAPLITTDSGRSHQTRVGSQFNLHECFFGGRLK